MNNLDEVIKYNINSLLTQPDTKMFKTTHMGNTLFLIHKYDFDAGIKRVKSGALYLAYCKPEEKILQNTAAHSMDSPVLEYKLVSRQNEVEYVELVKIELDEHFRRIGLGSLLLRFLENNIVKKQYHDVNYIKGIMTIGDIGVKKFYRKNGYLVSDNAFMKCLYTKTETTYKEMSLLSYIKHLLNNG